MQLSPRLRKAKTTTNPSPNETQTDENEQKTKYGFLMRHARPPARPPARPLLRPAKTYLPGTCLKQQLTVHKLEDERHVVAQGVLVEVALEVRFEYPNLLVEELEDHGRVDVAPRHGHEVEVEVPRVQEAVAVQLQSIPGMYLEASADA